MSGRARCWAEPDDMRAITCLICTVCGVLGNSLSFVLGVYNLCFRYFWFQWEELGMTALHIPYCSAFSMTLKYLDIIRHTLIFTMVL